MDATSARVAAVLERHLGMAVGSVGARVLDAALRRRMDATGVADREAYHRLLTADRAELAELTEAVVVPETWFFRYAESFRHLAEWAPKRKSENGPLRPLRVLSAPCSTGEEAYSIAVALLAAGLTGAGFKVDAVDVSRRAVEFARGGVYPPAVFRESVDPAYARYLERTGTDVVVAPAARAAVAFRQGNLVDPMFLAGEQPYDVIFCRNVFIYLTADARKAATDALDRLLAPGGLIYMGHAEPLAMMDPRFKSVPPPQAFAFRRAAEPAPARAGAPLFNTPAANALGGITALVGRPDLPGYRPAAAPPASVLPWATVAPAPAVPAPPPPPTEPPLVRAKSAADRGDVAEAVALCEESLKATGPNAEALALLGAVRLMAGNHAEAERLFTQALYLDPSHYDSLVHMMALAENRGDPKAATQYRRRAEAAAQKEGRP